MQQSSSSRQMAAASRNVTWMEFSPGQARDSQEANFRRASKKELISPLKSRAEPLRL